MCTITENSERPAIQDHHVVDEDLNRLEIIAHRFCEESCAGRHHSMTAILDSLFTAVGWVSVSGFTEMWQIHAFPPRPSKYTYTRTHLKRSRKCHCAAEKQGGCQVSSRSHAKTLNTTGEASKETRARVTCRKQGPLGSPLAQACRVGALSVHLGLLLPLPLQSPAHEHQHSCLRCARRLPSQAQPGLMLPVASMPAPPLGRRSYPRWSPHCQTRSLEGTRGTKQP